MTKTVNFMIQVVMEDGGKAVVRYGCDTIPVPVDALMMATENMMTTFGLESVLGFDCAMESLVKGAKSNKANFLRGQVKKGN